MQILLIISLEAMQRIFICIANIAKTWRIVLNDYLFKSLYNLKLSLVMAMVSINQNNNNNIAVLIAFFYLLIFTPSVALAGTGIITNNNSNNLSNNHNAYALSTQNVVVVNGTMVSSSSSLSNNSTASAAVATTNNTAAPTLITKLLANNLENRLEKAGAILNMTSKLPQVRNTSFAYLLNQTLGTLHGIPQNADVEKREIAKNILSSDKDLFEIVFIMPNGDVYFDEPYSEQKILTTNNLAFRDYFQGVIRTNDIYMGNVIISTASSIREALIAVPVHSLKNNNSTIVGIWAGGIDFNVLNKELQSLHLNNSTSAIGLRVIYVGHNGNKISDSDANKASMPESFANLTSFKNAAINGQSGSVVEKVDNTKMLITYQPVKAFHNTWAVLLMQQLPLSPSNQTIANSERQ